MSFKTDRKYVGPCTVNSCRLGHTGSGEFQSLVECHNLVAANKWTVKKPATYVQGNSSSRDRLCPPQEKSRNKSREGLLQFEVATWRKGRQHFP